MFTSTQSIYDDTGATTVPGESDFFLQMITCRSEIIHEVVMVKLITMQPKMYDKQLTKCIRTGKNIEIHPVSEKMSSDCES